MSSTDDTVATSISEEPEESGSDAKKSEVCITTMLFVSILYISAFYYKSINNC